MNQEERTLVSFDWAMKSILRDKANFDVLEGFLSTLLEQQITIISLLESESNQRHERDKFNRVDLLVHDSEQRIFVVEVQQAREPHYLQRLLYGASKLVVENIELGKPYEQVKKVISISILYFSFGEDEGNYLYHGWTEFYGLQNGKTLRWQKDGQTDNAERQRAQVARHAHPDNIFPEYYLIDVEQFNNVIQSDIDEWIYFFKNSSVRNDFASKNMETLRQKLDLLHMDPVERSAYERYVMDQVSARGMLESAKAEGKEEERRLLAQRMVTKGMSTDLIGELTGLTASEIAQIRAS
ncbi:MAG: Rpn family recombination-promoting nuclease/putative transposase [Caldilineaceae bacterium]